MLEYINRYFFGAATPVALFLAGIYFTLRLRGFHLRYPGLIARTLTAPAPDSGTSPAKALSLALAGTLGVGNIVGVASAIYLGGAGAVFWMWVSALCAMILKYAETVLALCHRRTGSDGRFHGGAMYYIKDHFAAMSRPGLGRALAAAFAVLCVIDSLSMGCVIQINAVSRSFYGVCGIDTAICGVVLALLCGVVMIRGDDRLTDLTGKLVPFMSLCYLLMSVAVMILCRDRLIPAFGVIFEDAFGVDAAAGGVFGFLTSRGLRFGTMRGLMSNEAGCGTAPIAHSDSTAKYPAEQGIWGIAEVFVDTIILCTMTALVIIIGIDDAIIYGNDPIMMTVRAYSSALGGWSEYVICLLVLFFGFATVICWSHYGLECVGYLSRKPAAKIIFSAIYIAATFVGAVCAPGEVWTLADFALGAMTLINLAVICPMSGEVAEATRDYLRVSLCKK